MLAPQEAVEGTIKALYGAALHPERWPMALDSLRLLFGGAASVVFLQDVESEEVPLWFGFGTEAGEAEYVEHIKHVNPRAKVSLASRPGTPIWDYRVLPEEALRRDPFYDWLDRVEGYRYFIGCRMFEQGSRSAFTSIEWPARHGHVQRGTIDLYRRILPHIEQAFRLTLSRAQSVGRSVAFEALVEQFDCGVVVLDRQARVCWMNGLAEATIAGGDVLKIERQRLRACKAADRRTLDKAIAAVVATSLGGRLASPAELALARRASPVPCSVSVMPLPVEPLSSFAARPAAAVLIRDPVLLPGPSETLLAELFGLTGREAQLAAVLVDGLALRQAADRLDMAYNTARNHLRGIFAKTGAGSQVELMRLLAKLGRRSGPLRLVQSD